MAQGGSFESGVISGAVSAVGSDVSMTLGAKDIVSNTVISAVAGGTASSLAGGKFANGAVTSAFATMFNEFGVGPDGKTRHCAGRACEVMDAYNAKQAFAEKHAGSIVETGAFIVGGEFLGAAIGMIRAVSIAARVFTSSDPLVGELATAIDAAYPGHVVGVNVVVNGQEVDILLQNAAIQVKSGSGTGLTRQVVNTMDASGLPTIGYGPKLGSHVMNGVNAAGGIATRSQQSLIELVKP